MGKYGALIEQLIRLKDKLKEDGYTWETYDCINDACNLIDGFKGSIKEAFQQGYEEGVKDAGK